MVVNRQTPTCPKCGEEIAVAKYHDIGLHGPMWVGDTLSHWEYFYHVCNCKHDWVYSDVVSLSYPPIKHKICKICGKKEDEQEAIIETEYDKLVKKFDALKSRFPFSDKSVIPEYSEEEILKALKFYAENHTNV